MLALTVFGLIALLRLQTDEFPDVAPPFVSVAIPYPGASPDGVEKRGARPDRGADRRHQRGEEDQRPGGRRLRPDHDRVRRSRSRSPRRPRTSATRSARSGTTCPTRWKEPIIKKLNDTDRPIVSLALTSTRLTAGRAHPARRPGDHARAALHSRRRRGGRLGQARAGADGGAPIPPRCRPRA